MDPLNFDVTCPTFQRSGGLHPIAYTIRRLKRIFRKLNFQEVSGPVVEDAFYNFTALNIPENHPARDCHDTFTLRSGKLLRSHATNTEIHAYESKKHTIPFGLFTIGECYRRDDDSTHLPMFRQFECFGAGKDMTFAHLKGIINFVLESFFHPQKVQVRMRPSYFPFTKPSVEVDIMLKDRWLEVMGAGMLRKNILESTGHGDFEAFAMGCGVERLAMIKHDLPIGPLYTNRFDFLSYFNKIASRRKHEA